MQSKPFPLYIMSGGKSSRFGSDKARALLHHKPLILTVAETFASRASSTIVVADQAGKYEDLGLQTIPDLAPHLGPIGGLQTALTHLQNMLNSQNSVMTAKDAWCFLVSCDMAGLRQEWVETLWSQRTEETKVVAFGPEPWDSMFACYRLDLLAEINRRVEQGQRAMWRLLQDTGTAIPHPPDWDTAVSINSPEDLKQFTIRADHAT